MNGAVGTRSGTWLLTCAAMALLFLVPFLPIPDRMQFMLAIALVYATAAVGLDVFSGYGGQLMLGSFAFVGLGAYGSAILATRGWNIWATLPTAVLACALIARLLGAALVRLPNLGIAMGSFFFAAVVTVLLRGRTLSAFTHGSSGLPVPPAELFGIPLSEGPGLYWLAWVVLALVSATGYRYANSRAGRALRLVKRSTAVASCMAIEPTAHRLYSFVFAAASAASGGFVYAQAVGFLAPENFDAFESINVLTMAIVGGLGTIAGPIIGSAAFVVVGEFARSAAGVREVLFSGVLLVCLVFFPRGMFGALDWIGTRRRARPGPSVGQKDRAPTAGDTRAGDPLALDLREVGVQYGGISALRGLDLRVEPGSIHAIIGPNGAGKTTLLNCISGLQRHTGSIRAGAELISARSPEAVRRLGIARTFQNPSLVADLTAVENVELGLYGDAPSHPYVDLLATRAVRDRDRAARAAALAALDLVGLPASHVDLAAADLTLAEQKLVDIARAAVGAKRLILLDEPTAGLEHQEIDRIASVLRALNRRSRVTIVLIAHHVGFVREVADRCTVLNFGHVLAEGTPEEVVARDDVAEIFLGAAHD